LGWTQEFIQELEHKVIKSWEIFNMADKTKEVKLELKATASKELEEELKKDLNRAESEGLKANLREAIESQGVEN